MRPPLVVILGATAVGKTALSLELAERFQGEIVGADSRQVYLGMDIGTAKPTPAERSRVPHHLIDVVTPATPFSLAEYQRLAYATIDDIHARGYVPFLVGGTALYVRAVVEGLRIPEVPPDPALRARLEADLARDGLDRLVARLTQLDPKGATVVDLRNPRRVLRALEIVLLTGQSKLDLEGAEPPPYAVLCIGLERPRAELHARIRARVLEMIDAGLAAETARLLDAGYADTLPAMSSLGYREMAAHLRGEMTLDQAVDRICIETNRFVRHQLTWFRRMSDIMWFDVTQGDTPAAVTRAVAEFLQREPMRGAASS
jgi:tRNA dimethylallyltransferase